MVRLVLLVLSASALAPTCNIPVFRYALERWQAAPYEVLVLHRGELTEEARAALNALRASGANLEIDRINLEEPVPAKRRAFLEQKKLDAPALVAVFPGSEIVAWKGPLTAEAAKHLADSPARREIS